VTLQVPTFSPLIVEPFALQYFAEEVNTFIDTVEPFNIGNFACAAKDLAVLLPVRDNCVADAAFGVVATAALCKSKLYVGSENDTAKTEIFSDSPTTVLMY
jgi:hypothetical protein